MEKNKKITGHIGITIDLDRYEDGSRDVNVKEKGVDTSDDLFALLSTISRVIPRITERIAIMYNEENSEQNENNLQD